MNVADLWKFTPLHEAAAKGKYEICKLLIEHGADPEKKNRDGKTPLDLVKETDIDIQVEYQIYQTLTHSYIDQCFPMYGFPLATQKCVVR